MKKNLHFYLMHYLIIIGMLSTQHLYSQCVHCQLCDDNNQNSSAIGYQSNAEALYSFASGLYCNANAVASAAIGSFLQVHPLASNSIVIGRGYSESFPLTNTVPNSIMFGNGAERPSMIIAPPVAPSNPRLQTGKIGIGNVTNPLAKLHIKADADEEASILVAPDTWTGLSTAMVKIGNANHGIIGSYDFGLVFKTQRYYLFNEGNLGIGTIAPSHLFHVAFGGSEFYLDNNTMTFESTGAGNNPAIKLMTYNRVDWKMQHNYANSALEFKFSNAAYPALFLSYYGYIGIGTTNPQSRLDVAGTVKSTGFQLTTNPVEGYVLTSNSSGVASWIDPELSYYWQKNLSNDIYRMSKVGIQIQNPTHTLEVEGNIGLNEFIRGKSTSPYDALWIFGSELATSPNIEIGRGSSKKGIKLICPDPTGDIQMHFNGIPAVFIQSDAANFGSTTHEMNMNVNGKIEATEVEIMIDVWQDQVFENSYPLMDLNSLEKYINENHHLPEIPTEEEVISNGINVGEMNALLLKKIEELTLYVIDLKKEIEAVKKEQTSR